MVGFYLYTPELPALTPTPSPDAYDWSMSAVLSAMFASLRQRGWSLAKEPLVGIGQTFGGPMVHSNHWVRLAQERADRLDLHPLPALHHKLIIQQPMQCLQRSAAALLTYHHHLSSDTQGYFIGSLAPQI